jgi:protein-disulfide isomerase
LQNKSAAKVNNKALRQQEKLKKQKRMKLIMWLTGICFIAVIAVAIIFQPKAKPLDVPYDELPMLGSANAPVKIVEFGDYRCPACQVFSQNIFPQLKKDYIDTGKVSFYFMDDIIISPIEESVTAAIAARSVFHQNKDAFWDYYDALYKNQQSETVNWATPEFLTELAKQQGIKVDYDKLRQDIDNKTYEKEVTDHTSFAQNKANARSTPTLLINGVKFEDVFDYEKIKAAIDNAQKGES